MASKSRTSDSRITMKQNPRFPGIEVKSGKNQFSRHAHIHQAWSFSFVLKGQTRVSLGTGKLELSKNQFIAVPPGVPHLCSPEIDSGFSFTVLYLPSEYLGLHDSEFRQIRSGEIEAAVVDDLVIQFLQSHSDKDLEISREKLRHILVGNSSVLFDSREYNFLDPESGSMERITQGSRFQEYRYARKTFGIGMKKISTIEKMERAKKLLSDEEDLADIALRCGFYDQSHFSRVFKLYTGFTPASYLKK